MTELAAGGLVGFLERAGVLPHAAGVACHDAWAPYDAYLKVTHALCNAYALRELQAVTGLAPDGQWCWAAQAADALRKMNVLVNYTSTGSDSEEMPGPGPDALADARSSLNHGSAISTT